MTEPLDILRAPTPRVRLNGQTNDPADFRNQYARARARGGESDLELAVAAFNAMHPVNELLVSAGVELHEQGREWHTVNGCPLPGCISTHDAFRVHVDRNAGDSRGPQWACRKCGRGGDSLRLAMLLAGADPNERGATSRFLRAHGTLADTTGQRFAFRCSGNARLDSRAGTGMAGSSQGTATEHPAKVPHLAQDRFARVRTSQHAFSRKETPTGATKHQATQQGQVPCFTCPVPADRSPVPATGEGVGSAPVCGRAQVRPKTVGGMGGSAPADPLRWLRPDAVAVFGRHPTPDEIEALDERASILEFDACFTRCAAESSALRLESKQRYKPRA